MNFSDFKVFIRSLRRNKLYSGITVMGFAVSLTFIVLLSVYIRQELSIDKFHTRKDRIFRMAGEDGAYWGALVGGQLKETFPDIEAYTRIYQNNRLFGLRSDGAKLPFSALYVDTAFWDMFTFPLREGRGFQGKNEVVLSLSFARKMFGNESPVGKDLNINGTSGWTIVGVADDFTDRTHFDYCDVFFNFNTLDAGWISANNSATFGTYLLEKAGADLQAKIPLMTEQMKKDFWMFKDNYRKQLILEPLESVYWSPVWSPGIHRNSRTLITVLMAIVAVILVLALVNYNNLSVARAGFRSKESAVKRLLGSSNGALFRQFIAESVTLCYIAFIIACFLAFAVLPWFNGLLNTTVVLQDHITFFTLLAAFLAVGIIGIIAGLVPAWLLTRFNPVEVVKGVFRKRTKGGYSKLLISFQFCMAITLIICTLVIWKQTDFMRNYNLGYDKENVVWLESRIGADQKNALDNELRQIAGVELISYAYGTPLDGGDNNTITNYSGTGKQISFQRFEVDSNFFKMLNLQVIPTGVAYDSKGVWLNETAVKAIEAKGLPEELQFFDQKLPVLGVIRDFHIRSLTARMSPLIVFTLQPDLGFSKILVKVSSQDPAGTYERIREVYGRFIQGEPFGSGFMDQTIDAWYEGNARTARLIGYFSVLAIVLSMMGILAMATYFIQQRVKEIGIRRVNGATIESILYMLMNHFMRWILLAFLVACPLAWFVMWRWMQDFPYHTDLSWWLFGSAGIAAFAVAALMVGWQSIKAATENPVNSLKSE